MFPKHHRAHIRLIHNHIDDGELGVWVVGGDLIENIAKGKARHDHGVGSGLGKAAERLLALGFRLQFNLAKIATAFALPTQSAVIGRLVERFVKFAPQIKDHGGLGRKGRRRERQRQCRAKDFGDWCHDVPQGMSCFKLHGVFSGLALQKATTFLWRRLFTGDHGLPKASQYAPLLVHIVPLPKYSKNGAVGRNKAGGFVGPHPRRH